MKRVLSTIICFLLIASTSPLLADAIITTTTVIGAGTFSPSLNVTLSANSDGNDYSAKTKHTQGDRRFGTGTRYPKIYYIASPVGATVTATSSPTFDFSNWTPI